MLGRVDVVEVGPHRLTGAHGCRLAVRIPDDDLLLAGPFKVHVEAVGHVRGTRTSIESASFALDCPSRHPGPPRRGRKFYPPEPISADLAAPNAAQEAGV